MTKKRGKKPLKNFKIEVGQLKEIEDHEIWNFRYRARMEGWKVKTKKQFNGMFMVFRSE